DRSLCGAACTERAGGAAAADRQDRAARQAGRSPGKSAAASTEEVKTSPLAPKSVPDMPAVAGVRLATAAAGIRYRDRTDVLLAILDPSATVAGVFTRSKCPSAPVEWCRASLKRRRARA